MKKREQKMKDLKKLRNIARNNIPKEYRSRFIDWSLSPEQERKVIKKEYKKSGMFDKLKRYITK